jgi:CubicO group peptidase (beta-lactamase class C family)
MLLVNRSSGSLYMQTNFNIGTKTLRAEHMCTCGICSIFLLVSISCRVVKGERTSDRSIDSFVNWIDTDISKEVSGTIPAIQVTVINRNEIVYDTAFGIADKKGNKRATDKTVFQAASISKSITAAGVLRFAEKNSIDLNQPVLKYVHEWKMSESHYDVNKITVLNILSHSSGLNISGYPGHAPDCVLPQIQESLSGSSGTYPFPYSVFHGISPGKLKLKYKPDSKWSYSGGGYSLLQLMIEEQTGLSFNDYITGCIFTPLNMNSSTFEYEKVDTANLAKPYSYAGIEVPNYLFAEKAAAGLYSTANDLAEFLIEIIRSYNEPGYHGILVSGNTVKNMMKPRIAIDGRRSMGLGFFLRKNSRGDTIAFHYGGNIGWSCLYAVNLERESGFVVLTNSNAAENMLNAILSEFMNTTY